MKVLRVISTMDPRNGGPAQGIRNVVPELEKSGVLNEVVCLDAADAPFLEHDTFTIKALGQGKGPWGKNPALLRWLISSMSNYDLVIVHGLWLYHSWAVRKAASVLKKQGKKVPLWFVMPHGMLDPYFQNAPDRKIKAIRNSIYWRLIEKRVVNESDGLLFTCTKELELARQTFPGYIPKKEINIKYGIMPPPLLTDAMTTAFNGLCPGLKGRPYLLFLSRIHEKKGVDILVKAYNELKLEGKKLPDLVVAGPGLDSEYGTEVKRLAGNTGDIHFPGMLQGNAKWGGYHNCEAFILPSHQENFGIAVVEAMACRKAVLISDQINIHDEIGQARAGIIESDTIAGAKNMIAHWVALSEAGKQTFSENAFLSFQRDFNIIEVAQYQATTLKSLNS